MPARREVLNNWAVVPLGGPYDAPELYGQGIRGRRTSDGRGIVTSRIVATEGRLVTTESGSVYELGEVATAYREWVESQGRTLDEAQPVRIRRRTTDAA